MAHSVQGILKLTKKGAGFLQQPPAFKSEAYVPATLIRRHRLPEGATISGPIKQGQKGPSLTAIETICGLAPEAFRARPAFRDLIAIDPQDRFRLSATQETSMRLIDLVAPIGKGTRGLIVAPPKAGKTMLLTQIAQTIRVVDPNTRLIMLLIDERPEEVTHIRREIAGAEVFASSSDQPVQQHVALSELMLGHIRTELECGHDVIVLVDSLTRLVRAFNLKGGHGRRSRTLSGGIEATALQIPRQLFGLARNIEDGGSVTILGTILVETGSRMDDLIFEEFKGTGNSEIVLDRALAEAYIFPALDLAASSTRREDQLYAPDALASLTKLRRKLASQNPKSALRYLLDLLETYPTNEDLLTHFK